MKQTITRASLTDKAYIAIRDLVLDGCIASGKRITVRPTSEQLGLSPTPVNAALALLAREGVLVSKLHRGFFVPELSVGDMREIYEVRRGPGPRSCPTCLRFSKSRRHCGGAC